MCRLPKSRASMDHAPGPIIANVNPSTPNARAIIGLPVGDNAIRVSTPATRIPAIGVHKPAISRIPASASMLFVTGNEQTGVTMRQVTFA